MKVRISFILSPEPRCIGREAELPQDNPTMPHEADEQGYRSLFGMPYYPFYYPDGSGIETRTKAFVEEELKAALEIENYERAAELRDELKEM